MVAALTGDDVVLCQITSQSVRDDYALALVDDDFDNGGLRQSSNIRPNRLFTADTKIILYPAGKISNARMGDVREKLMMILAG